VPEPIDHRIRDALITYTGAEPPLTFTYEQILSRGRGRRRRRRFALAAAVTTLAAVVAGMAFPALTKPYTPVAPAQSTLDARPYCRAASSPPPSPLISPSTVDRSGNVSWRPAAPPGHTAAQLSCYLATKIPPLLPGGAYRRSLDAPAGTMPLQAQLRPSPAAPGSTDEAVSAAAVVTDDQGAGAIGFGVVVGQASQRIGQWAGGTLGFCGAHTTSTGKTIVVFDTTTASGYRVVQVYVYAGDGIISARGSNGSALPAGLGPQIDDGTEPTRRSPPLTKDQLVDLACGIQLDFFSP
jgi:hypothetical protein